MEFRTPAESGDWKRLGEYVAARIDELGLQQSDIQGAGGPSPAKVRDIIHGRADVLRTSLRRGLERALRWDVGSVDRILGGKEPADADTAVVEHMTTLDLIDGMETFLDEIRRRATDQAQQGPRRPLMYRRAPGKDTGVGRDEYREQRDQLGGG